MDYLHVPVLCEDVLRHFDSVGDGWVVDGTLGLGGHTEALLERYPHLSVLGVEWDEEALQAAQERLSLYGTRFRAVAGSYTDLPRLLQEERIDGAAGVRFTTFLAQKLADVKGLLEAVP